MRHDWRRGGLRVGPSRSTTFYGPAVGLTLFTFLYLVFSNSVNIYSTIAWTSIRPYACMTMCLSTGRPLAARQLYASHTYSRRLNARLLEQGREEKIRVFCGRGYH
jgi:hypothetical protein